jgi:serine/threonine protein kinase
MGRVWAARDELLGREVAVKELVLPAGMAAEDVRELGERTIREARAIARLDHRNVVRIFDVVFADERPWIVMELVPSRSLYEVVSSDGPMPPEQVARIGLGVLAALRAAHRAGVLHRDVKPANVLLGDDGRVVLTDFGLATASGDSSMTSTGIVLGSPSYLAPERNGCSSRQRPDRTPAASRHRPWPSPRISRRPPTGPTAAC